MCVFEGALENSRVWSYIEVYVKSLWNQKALGKSFNLPEPQFPHLQSGEITVSHKGLFITKFISFVLSLILQTLIICCVHEIQKQSLPPVNYRTCQ